MKFEVVTFRSFQRYHDINYNRIKDLHIEFRSANYSKLTHIFLRKPNNCYRSL